MIILRKYFSEENTTDLSENQVAFGAGTGLIAGGIGGDYINRLRKNIGKGLGEKSAKLTGPKNKILRYVSKTAKGNYAAGQRLKRISDKMAKSNKKVELASKLAIGVGTGLAVGKAMKKSNEKKAAKNNPPLPIK